MQAISFGPLQGKKGSEKQALFDCATTVMRDLLGYTHQEQTTVICRTDPMNNKGV